MTTDLYRLAKEQSEELQRRLDRQTGYLWLAGTIQEPEKLRALFQVMARDSEEISAQSLKLQAILTQIRIQRQERKELMKQIPVMLILVLMTIFLLANMPTLAQEPGDLATNTPAEALVVTVEPTPVPVEVTAEPTPDAPPVVVVNNPPSDDSNLLELVKQSMPYLAAIAITLLVVLGTLGHQAIVNLGRSAPAPVREVAISGGDAVLKQVEEYAASTPTPIDDAVTKEARRIFNQFIEEWRMKQPSLSSGDQPGQVG